MQVTIEKKSAGSLFGGQALHQEPQNSMPLIIILG